MATFITSKAVGEFIDISINTTTGYWKYNHNGTDSSVLGGGAQSIEVLNANGEFTLISCDDEGTVSGDITASYLSSNQLTSFNGAGLSGLTVLQLDNNQLTGLDVSPMTSLTELSLNGKDGSNPLTASANDSILNQLEANGLTDGFFYTIGGRTAAGTADYDTLISRNWTIEGADLVSAVRKLRVKGVGQLNP